MGDLNGRDGVGERHGLDGIALDVRAGEELEYVGAAGDVGLFGVGGVGGRLGLGHEAKHEVRHGVAKVEGDTLGRVLRGACGVDLRAENFAGFDAAAQRDGIEGVRTHVDHGGEAATGEHVLHERGEGGGGLVGGAAPVRLGEVDVGVPEAGGDDAMVAGKDPGVGRRGDGGTDLDDASVADEDGGVVERRVVGRDVDAGVADDERAGGERLGRVLEAHRPDEIQVGGDGEEPKQREGGEK